MKNIIFIAVGLMFFGAAAQPYGEVTYQHTPQAVLSCGSHVIPGTGPGFVTAGYIRTTNLGQMNFSVDRTSDGGQLLGNPSEFQKEYQTFVDASCGSSPAQNLDCYGVTIIQTSLPSISGEYALVGANTLGVFFVVLDAAGVPVLSEFFNYPGGPYLLTTKPLIIESTVAPQTYFIVGNYGGTNVFALHVDGSGTVLSRINIACGQFVQINDIIESPFGGNNIIMVGNTISAISASDAWFASFDQGLTTLVNNNALDANLADQYYTSIEVANSTVGSPAGYIVGGYNDGSTSIMGRALAAKLNIVGNPSWCTTIEGAIVPVNGKVVKVLERKNTSANWEYYALAEANTAASVYKLDNAGIPFGITYPGNPDQFNYFNSSVVPIDMSLSNDIYRPDLGLHIYGAELSTLSGVYHFIESYFNGLNGCNNVSNLLNVDNYWIGGYPPTWAYDADLFNCANFNLTYNSINDYLSICGPNPSVIGGSNAKPLGVNNFNAVKSDEFIIKQDVDQQKIIVEFLNAQDFNEVTIYTIDGKVYDKIDSRNQEREINISTSEYQNGIYIFKCNNSTEFNTKRVAIIK